MSEPDPATLRADALDALGPHADPRARDVLRTAELAVVEGEARWVSSAGPVQGYGVTLGLDASTLGALRAAPAVVDALHAAVATALARHPGLPARTLARLQLRWSPQAGHGVSDGYRDRPPPPPPTLGAALVAYLDAAGENTAARVAERAAVSVRDGAVFVVMTAEARAELRHGGPASTEALRQAARDLVGGPATRVVIDSP